MTLLKQIWRLFSMTRRAGGWRGAARFVRTAPQQIVLFRRLLTDTRVPALAKAVLVGALVFAVSPLNVPQYIPVIGALDDLGIVMLAGSFFLKQIPGEILAEHRQAAGLTPAEAYE